MDHAGPFMNHYLLILVDSYSRWIDVHMVLNTETTVRTLRQIFSIFDLLHPDLSKKIHDKQNKNYTTKRAIRSFQVGDKLFAKNFSGSP